MPFMGALTLIKIQFRKKEIVCRPSELIGDRMLGMVLNRFS